MSYKIVWPLINLTASQGSTCAIIQTECCVCTPGESSKVTHLMSNMENQITALDDPLPNLDNLLGRWFGSGSSWFKSLLVT